MSHFEIAPLGDLAIRITGSERSSDLAAHLESCQLPDVVDIVPAFSSVGVYFRDTRFDISTIETALSTFDQTVSRIGRNHVIPVCYEFGNDLEAVSKLLTLTPMEVCGMHCGVPLTCRAVGFCPGFPYLGDIHPRLSGLARKDSPVLRVDPGTVAIAGDLCGIYTLTRPGGWWQIGRTPLTLVDESQDYFPIAVGDVVTFERISLSDYEQMVGQRL